MRFTSSKNRFISSKRFTSRFPLHTNPTDCFDEKLLTNDLYDLREMCLMRFKCFRFMIRCEAVESFKWCSFCGNPAVNYINEI